MMGGEFQWAHRNNFLRRILGQRLPRAVLVQLQLRIQDRRFAMIREHGGLEKLDGSFDEGSAIPATGHQIREEM